MTPEARVGKTANVVIFLGILYTVLTLVALVTGRGGGSVASVWVTLGIATGVIGLGYGIRSGSAFCLYLTTGLFAGFLVYFVFATLISQSLRTAVRLLLSGGAFWRLWRAIPALRHLHQTGSKPLRNSRFGDFFLRRKPPASDLQESARFQGSVTRFKTW